MKALKILLFALMALPFLGASPLKAQEASLSDKKAAALAILPESFYEGILAEYERINTAGETHDADKYKSAIYADINDLYVQGIISLESFNELMAMLNARAAKLAANSLDANDERILADFNNNRVVNPINYYDGEIQIGSDQTMPNYAVSGPIQIAFASTKSAASSLDQRKAFALAIRIVMGIEMAPLPNLSNLRDVRDGVYQVANRGLCANGYQKKVYHPLKRPSAYTYQAATEQAWGARKKAGESCASHGECQSEICSGADGSSNPNGTCDPVQICYQTVGLNTSCDLVRDCSNASSRSCVVDLPVLCSEGKCIEDNYANATAGLCASLGNQCNSNDQCCSGTCQANLCVGNAFCALCKEYGEKPSEGENCCPGMHVGLNGVCVPVVPQLFKSTSVKNKSLLIHIGNFVQSLLIGSAYAQESDDQRMREITASSSSEQERLSDVAQQDDAYKEALNDCVEQFGTDNMERVNNCVSQNYTANEQTVSLEQQDMGSQTTYISRFGAGLSIDSALTDPQNCQFNSLADYHRTLADPTKAAEANAEVVMRAFEMMFQNPNDQVSDMVSLEVNGRVDTIYGHLKIIANKVKQSRQNMVHSFEELDNRLTCRCIKRKGVTFFPDRYQFYRRTCGRFANTSDADETATASTERNIEKNSSGIAQEEELLNYLNGQRTTYQNRFNENSEVEADLSALMEAYFTANWNEGPAKSIFIRTRPVWWYLNVDRVVNLDGVYFKSTSNTHHCDRYGSTSMSTKYAIRKCEYFDVFLTPKNYRDDQCDVYGSKKACIKSLYQAQMDQSFTNNANYLFTQQELNQKVLLDPWLPKFYPVSRQRSYVDRVNTGFEAGIQYVKDHYLASGDRGVYGKTVNGRRIQAKKEIDIIDRGSPITDLYPQQFIPDLNGMKNNDGSYTEDYVFNQEKIDRVKCAMIRYASCGKEADCAGSVTPASSTNFNACYAPSTTHLGQAQIARTDDLGLATFFKNIASDEDSYRASIKEFAEYAYQMHFLWPALSGERQMYPRPGLGAYLEAIAYNLEVVGSAQFDRNQNLLNLANAYQMDLESRRNMYEDNVGDGTSTGSQNRELQMAQDIALAYNMVDFSNGQVKGSLTAKINDIKSKYKDRISATELASLSAANNRAVRIGKKKSSKLAGSDLKSTTQSQNALAKIDRLMNAPLSSNISSSKLSNTDGTSPKGEANIAANSPAGKENKSSASSAQGRQITINAPKFNNGSFKNSFGNNNFGGSSFSSSSNQIQTGNKEVARMLKAASEDTSLRENKESDSLFTIVSKVYKRNLHLVLEEIAPEGERVPAQVQEKAKAVKQSKEVQELKELMQK